MSTTNLKLSFGFDPEKYENLKDKKCAALTKSLKIEDIIVAYENNKFNFIFGNFYVIDDYICQYVGISDETTINKYWFVLMKDSNGGISYWCGDDLSSKIIKDFSMSESPYTEDKKIQVFKKQIFMSKNSSNLFTNINDYKMQFYTIKKVNSADVSLTKEFSLLLFADIFPLSFTTFNTNVGEKTKNKKIFLDEILFNSAVWFIDNYIESILDCKNSFLYITDLTKNMETMAGLIELFEFMCTPKNFIELFLDNIKEYLEFCRMSKCEDYEKFNYLLKFPLMKNDDDKK